MWLLISLVLAGSVAVVSGPGPPSLLLSISLSPSLSFSLSHFPLDLGGLNNVSEFSCAPRSSVLLLA